MENIVNKIIDIDRRADKRLSEARKMKEDMLSDITAECDKMRKTLSADADKRIAEVEKINRAELNASTAELEKEYRRELEEMNGYFDLNHVSIEDEIFNKIVGEQVEIRT